MIFEPVHCPKCKKEINFKAIAIVDEEIPQIQGTSYLIRCSKCGEVFKTGFRKGETVSEEELNLLVTKIRRSEAG